MEQNQHSAGNRRAEHHGAADSVFQPDSLLGFDYFEKQRRAHGLDPEQDLLLAVLEDALSSFKENMGAPNAKRKRQFQMDEAWIFNKQSRGSLNFEYICEVLRLDPGYIQKMLKQWREETMRRQRQRSTKSLQRLAAS